MDEQEGSKECDHGGILGDCDYCREEDRQSEIGKETAKEDL